MKKIFFILVIISLAAGGTYLYMRDNGHTNESILNTLEHIKLKASCSVTENLLIASSARITIQNLSETDRLNVEVRIIAYDNDGTVIQQKDRSILRPIFANNSLSKVVTLPAKTASCNCLILSSDK